MEVFETFLLNRFVNSNSYSKQTKSTSECTSLVCNKRHLQKALIHLSLYMLTLQVLKMCCEGTRTVSQYTQISQTEFNRCVTYIHGLLQWREFTNLFRSNRCYFSFIVISFVSYSSSSMTSSSTPFGIVEAISFEQHTVYNRATYKMAIHFLGYRLYIQNKEKWTHITV